MAELVASETVRYTFPTLLGATRKRHVVCAFCDAPNSFPCAPQEASARIGLRHAPGMSVKK